jgi:2-phospho-L-lactate/phosphoenolpyruvate guanylyltransferase
MPDVNGSGVRWAIVVPVKRLAVAKTRLSDQPEIRADLALAMALDTVNAALRGAAVERVVVVTDEPAAASAIRALGASVVADAPDAGLNPALVHGAREATVDAALAVAALSSDLPALRPPALDAVLAAAGDRATCVVTDAAGTGTTLLTARDPGEFAPRFGTGSRQAHVDAGAVDLSDLADESLRRDVDTVTDLQAALRLGVGTATTAALKRHPLLRRQPLSG